MRPFENASNGNRITLGKPGALIALLLLGVTVVAVGLSIHVARGGGPDAVILARFQCEKCAHVLDADLTRGPAMAELAPEQSRLDCPKCGAADSAWELVICPKCGLDYVPASAKTGQDAALDVCPHCGGNFMKIAGLRTRTLGKGERRQRK